MTPSLPSCSRCGTCCRKGGPALHQEDRQRVEQGADPHPRISTPSAEGEWADGPGARAVLVAGRRGDIIKIKGGSGTLGLPLFRRRPPRLPYSTRIARWNAGTLRAGTRPGSSGSTPSADSPARI
ncbi:MAG: hypothetical protein MZU95_03395 [Desulfomicrobium escambiense]|nr:hypothetical protein [Desulfomicrobium escambiense]